MYMCIVGRPRLGFYGHGAGQVIFVDIYGGFHYGYDFDPVRGSGSIRRHEANRPRPVVHR